MKFLNDKTAPKCSTWNILTIIFAFIIILSLFFIPFQIKASNNNNFLGQIKILDIETLKVKNSFQPWEISKIVPRGTIYGSNLGLVDLGGDDIKEILVANSEAGRTIIMIFRNDGSLINQFSPFPEFIQVPVNISAIDLDQDSKQEIIASASQGGGPNVRVFDGFGNLKLSFFAFDANNRGGVAITSVNFSNSLLAKKMFHVEQFENLIITGAGNGLNSEIKMFDKNKVFQSFPVLSVKNNNGLQVNVIDLGGDGVQELLISSQDLDKNWIDIYRIDGSLINRFVSFVNSPKLFHVEQFENLLPLDITVCDTNQDQKDEIIVGAGFLQSPEIKIFDGFGQLLKKSLVFDDNLKGGVNLVCGNIDSDKKPEIVISLKTYPQIINKIRKYIDIDVAKQRFKIYQDGFLLGDFATSTGKRSTPTRLGSFKVLNKLPMAYGSASGEYWKMPWWIGFYWSGGVQNGIHALPYINNIKESAKSLGRAISHGCVRLDDETAKKVYDWVEIGDEVVAHR